MKALLTLLFALLIGTLAQARDRAPERKVVAVQMELVQVKDIQTPLTKKENQVARLYRRAGSRVKKELHFTTKNDHGIA